MKAYNMSKEKLTILKIVSGGFSALVVAMGVGRFAYTPLLPEMQAQFGFNNDIAGSIASINYIGYLIGALLFYKKLTPDKKKLAFRLSLIGSMLTTISMGIFTEISWWMILRFFSGVASAGVFIFGSSIVMEKLQHSKYSHFGILMYSGVGAGIVISGIASPVFLSLVSVQITWIGLAFICLPFSIFSWFILIPDDIKETIQPKGTDAFVYPKLLPWLIFAYFCEGFGYIVSGTFLVSFLQNQINILSSGNFAWVVVGLTASISVPLFQQLSKRIQPVHVLIIAYVIQGIGILIPVFSKHWIAVNLGAILFGGTFMGITAITLSIGKHLRPAEQSQMVIGLLTAIYGIGQVVGPLISGILSERYDSFTPALVMSALTVFIGAIFLVAGIYQKKQKTELQIIRKL